MTITAIDNGYLHWLHDKLDQWDPPLREAIIAERARRKGLASPYPVPSAQTSLATPSMPRRRPSREEALPGAVCVR